MFSYTKLMQAMVAAGVVTDPYFNLVTLLLPGNGTNGAQNNTFLDSSTNNFTITRNGNTTQGTFSPFSQTGWGNFFNGSNAYLSIGSNAVLAPGTGDFWVECWINLSNLPSSGTTYAVLQNDALGVSTNDKFWFGVTNNAGTYRLQVGRHGTSDASYVNWTPSIGVWYHIAYGRSSGTSYLFIDGVSQTVTGSLSGISFGQNGVVIGAVSTPYYFPGYISNLRYIVGAVLYTSTFTPSTTPLTTTSQGASSSQVEILTCQDNRFIDNSSNAFTITANGTPSVQAFSPFAPTAAYDAATNGGSGYFDGSGDYLSVGTAADWTFLHNTTAAWTMEFWVYNTTTGSSTTLLDTNASTTASTGVTVQKLNNEFINVFITYSSAGNNIVNGTSNITLKANAWNHVFISYDQSLANTNLVFYINGAAAGTANKTANTPSSGNPANALSIATYGAGAGQFFPGYIGSLRISNTVRSTPSSVPTSPYTSDANTKLLANYTNAGIVDSTAKNVLETVGNAQISTTQSKFGGSSMYFDGTGDYLTIPNSAIVNLSGDFTIEAWVYRTTINANTNILGVGSYAASANGFTFYISSTNYLAIYGNGAVIAIGATTTIPANTWTYVALVRSGTATNNLKLYVNGTLEIQATNNTSFVGVANNGISVGADYSGSAFGATAACYIDDLRLTRYARTISTPTSAFPLQ